MITFETQEDFEDAVMKVVRERLEVRVSTSRSYFSDGTTVKVFLDDGYNNFSKDEDSV